MGSEAVSQVKIITSTVQVTCGKGFNKNQLSNIWVIYEELAGKAINKKSQFCKHHADNSSYWQLSTNNIMLQYSRFHIVFFIDTLLSHTTLLTRGNKYAQLYVSDEWFLMIYLMKSQLEFNDTLHCFYKEIGVLVSLVMDIHMFWKNNKTKKFSTKLEGLFIFWRQELRGQFSLNYTSASSKKPSAGNYVWRTRQWYCGITAWSVKLDSTM